MLGMRRRNFDVLHNLRSRDTLSHRRQAHGEVFREVRGSGLFRQPASNPHRRAEHVLRLLQPDQRYILQEAKGEF